KLRTGVVVTEVALSFVLLIGCGLMIRSFVTLANARIGFDPEGVITFTLSNRNFARMEDRVEFINLIHDRLMTVPGVAAATAATAMPFSPGGTTAPWGTTSLLQDPARAIGQADLRGVTPGYFELLRIPLVAGRLFAAEDTVFHGGVIIQDEMA